MGAGLSSAYVSYAGRTVIHPAIVKYFISNLSVNKMSSGCFASAEQGESNYGVTTSLLLDHRGVSLRLTHNL